MNWFTKVVSGRGTSGERGQSQLPPPPQKLQVSKQAGWRKSLAAIGLAAAAAAAAALLAPASASAQVATNAIALSNQVVTPYGTPAPNAAVRICLIGATGSPCSTAGVILYSDPNLSYVTSNPIATDQYGNYKVFVVAGAYMLQVTPAGAAGPTYTYYYIGTSVTAGTSGFPITLGSTAIASGSTTTALTGLSVNGVLLTTADGATTYLNGAGAYTTPAGGTVTNFIAPSASWPSWLVPTVTNPTTAPSLAVAASAIPNSALANYSIIVDGITVPLGGSVDTGTAFVQTSPTGSQSMNIPTNSNFAETNTNLGIASSVAHSLTTEYAGQGFDLGNPWHTFNTLTKFELNLARGNNQMETVNFNNFAAGDSNIAYETMNTYGGKLYYNDEGPNMRTMQMHQAPALYGPLATPAAGNIYAGVYGDMGIGNTWFDVMGPFPTTGSVSSVTVYFSGTTTAQTAYVVVGTPGINNQITLTGSQIVPVTIPAATGAHYQTFSAGSTLPSLTATAGQILGWYQAAGESPAGTSATTYCLPASGVPAAGTYTMQTSTAACNAGVGYYGAIVIGASQATPTAGATSIWVSPPSIYGYSDYNIGGPQFADGSIVYDQSQPVGTATIGGWSGGTSPAGINAPLTSGTVPVSTAVGSLSACSGSGTGETQVPTAVTCTVTLAATPAGGAFTTGGGVLAISGSYGETALVTSVTSLSGGTQTIVFNSTYPASAHNGETIGQGGLAGTALVITSTVGNWPVAWQVIASPTTTSITIADCTVGSCFGLGNYIPPGNSAVTFYPMTFANGTANGISGSALLLPNAVPFTVGDTIVDAPTSEYSAIMNFEVYGQMTPTDYSQPGYVNYILHDGAIAPVADFDIEQNPFGLVATNPAYMIRSKTVQFGTVVQLSNYPTSCFACWGNNMSESQYFTLFGLYNLGNFYTSATGTGGPGFGVNTNFFATTFNGVSLATDGTGTMVLGNGIKVASARKGTFTCSAGGTITVANTNELLTSDVVISLNTAGGTITTPPAMKTVTSGTGFTILCGASDTSIYNYDILN